TRWRTLPRATAETARILEAARAVLAAAAPAIAERGLTLIGVSLGDLRDDRAVQLALPLDGAGGAGGDADAAVDGIRDRFGSPAIPRAVLPRRHQGLPDHPNRARIPDRKSTRLNA